MNSDRAVRELDLTLPRRGPQGSIHTGRLAQEKPPGSLALRSVHALLFAAVLGCVAPAHAANCTVDLPEYVGRRSGECFVDDATQTVVIYDAEHWGNRGRKLLVPQLANGRKPASYIAISPTDVFSDEVANAMNYRITLKTSKGLYIFEGKTQTRTYRAHTPPSLWIRQRPNEDRDYKNKITTAELLAELRALKPVGPALSFDLIEKVITQNQELADRLPTLAGITHEGNPLPSTASRPMAGEARGHSATFGPPSNTSRTAGERP